MTEIVVKTDEVRNLAKEGGKFVFKRDAEKQLNKLLELQEFINEQVEIAKEAIIEAGTAIDETFGGAIGEEISANYRYYGNRYEYSDVQTAKPFLKEITFYKVDPKKVDEYMEEVGEIPPGIRHKERTKSLSIKKLSTKEV